MSNDRIRDARERLTGMAGTPEDRQQLAARGRNFAQRVVSMPLWRLVLIVAVAMIFGQWVLGLLGFVLKLLLDLLIIGGVIALVVYGLKRAGVIRR